jgi:uncharacterized membrane protein
VSQSSRVSAFLAYFLLVLGWLYVFILHRQDKFAVYHAKQSIMLVMVAIATPVVWVIFGWLISFIPLVGPVLAVAGFALVIAAYVTLIVMWVIGMINALRAKARPLPMIGRWAERLPINSAVRQVVSLPQETTN